MLGQEEIAIIGAGPAGAAAAVQLRRMGSDPLVFEEGQPGGLLRSANLVENYPGFPDGIAGKELAELIAKQMERFRVRLINEKVISLDYRGGQFFLQCRSGICRAGTAILSAGTVPRKDHGIVVSGGAADQVFYNLESIGEGADTVIIGAGDAAFDYALNLGTRNRILILGRSNKPRALKVLVERAEERESIDYLGNVEVSVIEAEKGELLLRLKNHPEQKFPEPFDSGIPGAARAGNVLFATGRCPATGFLSDRLIEVSKDLERQGRLFFAGDIRGRRCRQAAVAAGDGLRAAMKTGKGGR